MKEHAWFLGILGTILIGLIGVIFFALPADAATYDLVLNATKDKKTNCVMVPNGLMYGGYMQYSTRCTTTDVKVAPDAPQKELATTTILKKVTPVRTDAEKIKELEAQIERLKGILAQLLAKKK